MDMLELGGEIPTKHRSGMNFRKIVILFPLSLRFAMNYLLQSAPWSNPDLELPFIRCLTLPVGGCKPYGCQQGDCMPGMAASGLTHACYDCRRGTHAWHGCQ